MAKEQSGKLPLQLDEIRKKPRTDAANHRRFSTKAERQELFLPISGFVWFYPEEIEIIDHPAFQRLGRINQLGLAYLVFRGGTHKRIEHSLGAVHVAQRMISAVQLNSDKAKHKGRPIGEPLSDAEQRFVRLGALLHDIGHLAAGHTLEDELGLLPQHDGDERLDIIFTKNDFDPSRPKTLQILIDELYEKYVPESLKGQLSASAILRILIRKRPSNPGHDRLKEQQALIESGTDIRWKVCSNMIGNTICADLLDYLFRDWHHIGKPRAFDDRIFQYMEIRTPPEAKNAQVDTSKTPADEFVVSLGRGPRVRTDGVSAILELLEWRYQLAETVLFHRTKLAAAAMLDRALFELWEDEPDQEKIVRTVLTLSDEELIDNTIDIARERLARDKRFQIRGNICVEQLSRIRNRNLYEGLKTWGLDELGKNAFQGVRSRFGAESPDKPAAARARTDSLRELELDFKLPPGSLAMYCSEVKPKIAEVSISVGDVVKPFDKYEETEGDHLSGGHLVAQIKRFHRLRRIHYFISPEAKETLEQSELLGTLIDAIEKLVLTDGEGAYLVEHARDIAHALAGVEHSKWHGTKVLDVPLRAAKGDTERSELRGYPSGAPSIRSFFVRDSADGSIRSEDAGGKDI